MAWVRELYDTSILEELRDYRPPDWFKTEKAHRVWCLCIDQGHIDLAKRIYDKYWEHTPSDRLIAFQYGLMASQIANHPNKLK